MLLIFLVFLVFLVCVRTKKVGVRRRKEYCDLAVQRLTFSCLSLLVLLLLFRSSREGGIAWCCCVAAAAVAFVVVRPLFRPEILRIWAGRWVSLACWWWHDGCCCCQLLLLLLLFLLCCCEDLSSALLSFLSKWANAAARRTNGTRVSPLIVCLNRRIKCYTRVNSFK